MLTCEKHSIHLPRTLHYQVHRGPGYAVNNFEPVKNDHCEILWGYWNNDLERRIEKV